MNKSRRLYLTFNPNKEKDCVILEYLASTYNESETIKNVLYQIATNRCYEMNLENNKLAIKTSKEVQKGEQCSNEVQEVQDTSVNKHGIIDIDDDIKKLFG